MRPRGVQRLFRFSRRTREQVRADVDEELALHLDLRSEELARLGLSREAARAQAEREFGDRAAAAAGCAQDATRVERRRWHALLLGELRQDVSFGTRLLLRSPGFSGAAILTLALAIGANTAIFSVVNALLFKPAPVAASEQLARIHSGESQMSWLNYEDVRDRQRAAGVFTDVVAHRLFMAGLATEGAPVRLLGQLGSPNYLRVLGIPATLGRTFDEGDPRRDVVVLADHVWRARFAADPAIVGRVLTLQGRRYEVVGVMPRGFRGIAPPGLLPDFWAPIDSIVMRRLLEDRSSSQFEIVGRLSPGVTHERAAAALQTLARQMRAEHPAIAESFLSMRVFPIDGFGAFQGMAGLLLPILAFLALLSVVSLLVLVIGCANIAGLLLGRAAARRREIAVRLALGAARGRLVRQLLTESLLLSLLGGAAGVLFAMVLAGGLNALAGRLPISVELDLALDRRVLLYAIGLSTCTCLLFGLAPARRAARFDVVSSLKDEAGSTARQRLRRALIVGQVAVCSLLLVWSGLFARSLGHVNQIDPGFDANGVLVATVELDQATTSPAEGDRILVALQQHVRALPAVQAAGIATVVPLSLRGREDFSVWPDGDETRRTRVVGNRLSPGWLETLRIPLVAGRDFTWEDREGAPAVAMVNETLARQFPNGGAVGRRLRYGTIFLEVVGVVRDSKYRTPGETIAPTVYLPLRQRYMPMMALHVRTDLTGPAHTRPITQAIVREMQRLAPDALVNVESMVDATAAAAIPARIGAAATAAFGAAAMLLAMIGVYGLISFTVVQRTRELGVRKALGARTPDILRLIVGGSAWLTATGLALGLGAGALGGVVLQAFLAGVSPADPATLFGVAVLVLGPALAASAVPGLRAARVDPLITLRD
jgi:predicted permease